MPIAIGSFNLDEYRKSVQALSDEQLLSEGKLIRWLSGDGKIISTRPSTFDEQLRVCREELTKTASKIADEIEAQGTSSSGWRTRWLPGARSPAQPTLRQPQAPIG
jgi:hypothetical protein